MMKTGFMDTHALERNPDAVSTQTPLPHLPVHAAGAHDFLLVTCEHGGNRIPSRYRALFNGHETLLHTHRAYDPGALRMARDLASALHAPLCASTTSRLLIDLNRSVTHPRLYSEATRVAPAATREEIRRRYYAGYRNTVEQRTAQAIVAGRRALHVSVHSFTPKLNGIRRNADIGLLYDPGRSEESAWCRRWRAAILARMPGLKIRMNYPYAGKSDGITTFLRRRFSSTCYLGIEVEINQQHVFGNADHWRRMRLAVIDAMRETLACSHGRDSR